MWTIGNRHRYDSDHLRYPRDLSDAEWALIEPFIPPARHGGRRRQVNEREVVNAIMHVLSNGCQWRALPEQAGPHHAKFPSHAGAQDVSSASHSCRNS
jgi:transposase